MTRLLWSRTSLVWALMVGATVLSFELGHGVGLDDGRIAGTAILLVTFVKVRFVILEFMEIRDAPRWMRIAGQGWIVLICSLLVGLYLAGSQH